MIQAITEILFPHRVHISTRYSAGRETHHVGDRVKFRFCGLVRHGRVSNIVRTPTGRILYCIETASGQWFQNIPELDIIN